MLTRLASVEQPQTLPPTAVVCCPIGSPDLVDPSIQTIPYGVSKFNILYALAKLARQQGAFKMARYAYSHIQKMRVPSTYRAFVEEGAVSIRCKPMDDDEDLLPLCFRCSAANPLLRCAGVAILVALSPVSSDLLVRACLQRLHQLHGVPPPLLLLGVVAGGPSTGRVSSGDGHWRRRSAQADCVRAFADWFCVRRRGCVPYTFWLCLGRMGKRSDSWFTQGRLWGWS